MNVVIVGMGRVGTAFATLLERAGHRVVGDPTGAAAVFITTPDDRIEEACADLASRAAVHAGQFVIHTSGATGLDALRAAEERGAEVLSLHPLQTFPDVEAVIEHLPGSAVAVTARTERGEAMGHRIAEDLGARPFHLPEESKPLYHAAAVFSSNYLVAVLGIAEDLYRRAGLDDPVALAMPLARAALDGVEQLGPTEALTGPVVRGDARTIEANLESIRDESPERVMVYVALARETLELAARSGRLDDAGRRRVEEVLDRWT